MLLPWAMLMLAPLGGLAQGGGGFGGDQPAPPPEPYPVDVSAARGEPVWITLSAYSLTSPIIRFRIKRAPKGSLGTPKLATPETGTLKYIPPAGTGPGEDSFEYEVQSAAGVSAPAEVRIKITDKDPLLVAPNDLEFGNVLPGESGTQGLVLQNIGGGLAEGTVSVPDGWSVEGDASYHLTAGQQQSFKIIFSPTQQEAYTGDINYTGNPERATDLNGVGVGPISITSGTVELEQAGAMRAGEIGVENRTDAARTLKVTAGPHLEAERTLNLPAKSTVEIEVRAKGEDGEILDQVTIEGEGITADVPVHAAALVMATPVPNPSRIAQVARPPAAPAAAGTPNDSGNGPPPPGQGMEQQEMQAGILVRALDIGKISRTEAEVDGNFDGAPVARSYRLEIESLKLDAQGMPAALWAPFANAAITANGMQVSAQMQNLQPGGHYEVRLVGLDGEGNVIERTAPGSIWTLSAKKGWSWKEVTLVAAAGALGVWYWRKRQATG